MTLNATLIVQILNFMITWCVVRYLFMRPAIKIRDSVYGGLRALSAERDQLQGAMSALREQEYRAWHVWYLQAQNSISKRYEHHTHRMPVPVRVSMPDVPVSEVERVTERLTALVVVRLEETS
jgi:hypothetical protein